MHNFHLIKNYLYAAIALLITSMPHQKALAAQDSPTYHIEAVIFERTNTAYSAPETWRNYLALSYSPDYRLIKNLDEVNSSNDSGHFLFERPANTYRLNAEAKAVAKIRNFRVLFHKAWQQTLTRETNSPDVVITGGSNFDNYFELSGSIRISLGKFIHISTNLWLTQFTPNLGATENIPRLPLTPEEYLNAKTTENDLNASMHSEGLMAANRVIQNGETNSYRNYQPKEIIVLEQSRRMRSNELHYIDHPRLGVLIKIIPITNSDTMTQSAE